MGTIRDMVERVKRIDLESQIPKLIEQTAFEITALNQQQLHSGLLSTGTPVIPKYKNPYYAAKKAAMNPLPGLGVPDTFLTGAFYKGMGVVVSQTTFTTNSVDFKASKLETQYGSALYGLDDKSKADYAINTLLPKIREYINDVAGI